MTGSGISWRLGFRVWLWAVGFGVLIAFVCRWWEHAPMSEGGSSVFPFLVGVFGALLELVCTFPLRLLVDPVRNQLWWLVVPNFALLGVFPGVAFALLGGGNVRKVDGDRRPYFRMNDIGD